MDETGYMPINKTAEDTVAPSKLYGILAGSKPVLLLSSPDSELSSLVTRENFGLVFGQGDSVQMSNSILNLMQNPEILSRMSRNAQRTYLAYFSRSSSTSKYYTLLQKHGLI